MLEKNHLDLDIHWVSMTEERIRLLHEQGTRVNVWTCDDPEAAARLAGCGVDMITSNCLE